MNSKRSMTNWKSRGKLARIHKIQILNPDTIVKHTDLYMSIMFGRSPLGRAQREMMAVVVPAADDCEYCQYKAEAYCTETALAT